MRTTNCGYLAARNAAQMQRERNGKCFSKNWRGQSPASTVKTPRSSMSFKSMPTNRPAKSSGYEEAKQAEYRAREIERSRDAYTADAKKRCKSVERLRKAGLLK